MAVRGSKGKEVKHWVLETESNQSTGGRVNRNRADSHPSSLLAALTCAESFFLVATRGGRKHGLQRDSSASAVIWCTCPHRQEMGPQLPPPPSWPGQLLVVPVLRPPAGQLYPEQVLHFYRRAPKKFIPITLPIVRCTYLT